MKTKITISMIAGILMLALWSPVQAEVKPGIRLGTLSDPQSFMIGGEVLTNLNREWYLNPNVEYISQPNADFWAINFDVHYDIPTRHPFYFWVGGGPAILHRNPDGSGRSTTDPAANLFFGVGFRTQGRVVPYIQPKVVISEKSHFGIAVGARF